MKIFDPKSLEDIDPGPWKWDPETHYWCTASGLIAIPTWIGELTSYNRWTNEKVFTTQVRKAIIPAIHENAKGYLRLNRQFVHRVVARAWVPNPENKPQVHHIDHNKHNNSADNLQWVTNSENIQAAYDFGLMANRPRNNKGQFV